ncbi:hypothetical protein QJS10_CPB04g01330 [Acorus calamus]|uniref:Casein kinase II subunit beta n=1 Tax=Acorus calamus TaxID=4465 RepID=A0AAV9F2U7_ACOCL|nr:hypothetical protein QJS10_CPB04g01330 [Acorus calamus]
MEGGGFDVCGCQIYWPPKAGRIMEISVPDPTRQWHNFSKPDQAGPAGPYKSDDSNPRSDGSNRCRRAPGRRLLEEPSDTGSEETDLSSSEGDDSSWISWFCGLRGNELLCEVDEDYIQDDFKLCGLQGPTLQILNIMLQDVKSRLLAHGVGLEVSDAVMDLVCHQGYDKRYGARPLRRAVIQLIEDVISESMLSEEYQPGDVAVIDVDA